MSQQKSKADAVGVALSHTRSISEAHTPRSISTTDLASSLRERDIRITNLERQVSQLTRLIRLLADRAALDLSEGQDDSLAWIQAELRRLEEAN